MQLRSLRPLSKLHIEFHSIEVKLYEGADFDFTMPPP
jgi:hypothetical protein